MTTDDKGNKGSGQSLDGLHKAFGDMSKAFQALPGQVAKAVEQGINTAVAQQQSAQQRQTKAEPKRETKPAVSESDIEKMSRTEFARYLMEQVTSGLDEKLQPFQESVQALSEMSHKDRLSMTFEQARGKFKDFDQWKDEMAALVERTGLTDPEDLYTLARSKNPDKAKELDEAAKAADKEIKQTSKEAPQKPSFLGLMPTNSPPSGESSEGPKFKTTQDAAASAFDEIMAGLPDEIGGSASQV